MSYQPPGPYPVFPQYPGGPAMMPSARPPLPATVLRAHYCMLAGAVLTLVSVGLTLADASSIKSAFEQSMSTSGDSTAPAALGNAVIGMVCFFALIEAGLWVWMAFATKSGKHWARILSTVFFGLEAAGQLFGTLSLAASSSTGSGGSTFSSSDTDSLPGTIVGWLTFGVGLAAIILLWNKASGPYFKPQFQPAPYGYPGVPMPYPVMPGQPMQPMPPQDPAAGPQPPTDPWNTTPPSS